MKDDMPYCTPGVVFLCCRVFVRAVRIGWLEEFIELKEGRGDDVRVKYR